MVVVPYLSLEVSTMFFLLTYKFGVQAVGKSKIEIKTLFQGFDSFNFVSMFFLGLLNWYFVLPFYLCHNLYSTCVLLLLLMSAFVVPCCHRDRDCCIGSKFCKFCLIRTLFTLLVIS